MKCTIPEISWHNKDPVLSIDIQPSKGNDNCYRFATGGTDTHISVWMMTVEKGGVASLECTADLTRHTKPVNCVRFSPCGDLLASGDDEAFIILWKMKVSNDPPEPFNEGEEGYKEKWISVKVLRGHLQDVCDLSWSADSKNLISGSIDNTAILWDVQTGRNLGILTEHKGFVQGVSWDPLNQYVATISSDRTCRVYNTASRRVVSKMHRGHLPGRPQDPKAKPVHYFHDDTFKSFFRRLSFSPDGQLLLVPSGIIEEPDKKSTNSTVVFHRNCFQKPVAYLPTLSHYTVAVRCCPVLFTLREMDSPPLFQLPYRMVIAVATQSHVILYDTQHAAPFAFISNIHYIRLSDISWSSDGRVMVVSSTDGYCSLITFSENELGTPYTEESAQQFDQKHEKSSVKKENQSKPPSQKGGSDLNSSKDLNMSDNAKDGVSPLASSPATGKNGKQDVSKTEISKTKETPMEVDDFSLEYEGTIVEPVLESTATDEVKNAENQSSSLVDSTKSGKSTESNLKELKDAENKGQDVKNESPKKASEPTKSMQEEALTSPKTAVNITPGSKKTPRRVQLITLSSPKSKKKLLD